MMLISLCRPSATLRGVHTERKIITTNKTQIKKIILGENTKRYQEIRFTFVLSIKSSIN